MSRYQPWFVLLTLVIYFQQCLSYCSLCECRFIDNLINCTNKNLSALPEDLHSEVMILSLAQNNFNSIPSLSKYNNLVMVNLSYNRIANIERDSFKNLTQLKVLDISNNFLKHWTSINKMALNNTLKIAILNLSHNALFNASVLHLKSDSLTTLKLNNCSIKEIKNEFFNGFPNLIVLELSYNQLVAINEFPPLRKLKILNLQNNNIYRIYYEAFINLKTLEKLILDNNHGLSYLNITLGTLKELFVTSCNIDAINLSHLANLTRLLLNENSLSKIPEMNLPFLKYLDLSNNKISTVGSKVFKRLESVEYLFLSYNTISSLLPSTFNTNFRLKTLDLSHNYLNEIVKFDIESLSTLNVSNCEITTLKNDCLSMMPFLKTLILAKNGISKLPNYFNGKNLIELDLTYCRILTLNNLTFASMPKLKVLYLRGNRLSSDIQVSYFHNVKKVYLADNAWKCDCNSNNFQKLYDWVQIRNFGDKLTCQLPENLEGKLWIEACYDVWFLNEKRTNTVMYCFIVFLTMVTCVCIFLTAKRACRIKKERAEELRAHQRAESERISRENAEIQRRNAFQNAPDPREAQGPPSYTEALLMPRLDGSYSTLSGSRPSLTGSKKSLNNISIKNENRQKVRRKKRRPKSTISESRQSSSRENIETDSEPPEPSARVFMESSI